MKAANDNKARLLTREQAAAYCGYGRSNFSRLVSLGALPAAIPGLARWDKKAIDDRLDKISGLERKSDEEPMTWARWKRENAS